MTCKAASKPRQKPKVQDGWGVGPGPPTGPLGLLIPAPSVPDPADTMKWALAGAQAAAPAREGPGSAVGGCPSAPLDLDRVTPSVSQPHTPPCHSFPSSPRGLMGGDSGVAEAKRTSRKHV